MVKVLKKRFKKVKGIELRECSKVYREFCLKSVMTGVEQRQVADTLKK